MVAGEDRKTDFMNDLLFNSNSDEDEALRSFQPKRLFQHDELLSALGELERVASSPAIVSALEKLNEQGYAVVEDFLPLEMVDRVCAALGETCASEVCQLKPGRMNNDGTAAKKSSVTTTDLWNDAQYRGDRIAFVKRHDPRLPDDVQFVVNRMDEIRDLMNAHLHFSSDRVEVSHL
eukprot:TRINITY_DN19625_c0_g1_i5.p1 TRINITY_DN19625_c0_g1~~TRINITY_DN19625_c0_g1_i5.p1  ORF type:complete len:177 (-),score=46.34 TRINITY_DN19625_c0_g1_i5:46-576(-)